MTRVGPIAGAVIVLAAACSPDDRPTVAATELEPVAALVAAPTSPKAVIVDGEPGGLLDSQIEAVVAGESLNVDLLRRFYARRDFKPVWATRRAQANSLMDAVSRARDHGLSPQLFHADVLQSSATLSTVERELLLSDAVLSYAHALAHGAMPIERRRDDEALTTEPVDVATVLDVALDSPDAAAMIEGLAPTTPTYRLLREAARAGLSGGKVAASRSREIEVNLERQRWLPRRLPANRVWVNVPDARLVAYRDDQPAFTTRVIVGQSDRRNQSPEFQASIDHIVLNPPWTVPEDIATEEILPKLKQDPTYLARHRMIRLPSGELQQQAPNSALGQFLFEMRNRFDVYLHDTPSKNLFARDDRRISHGCIRVENAHKLAALLMRQSGEAIDQVLATGETTRSNLPEPVAVFVVYQTAFADADGKLQFRPDIYGRDDEIWRYLNRGAKAR